MTFRDELGGRTGDGAREQQGADQVRAAAVVLLARRLAGLVRADRDVLGTVVRGQLLAAERDEQIQSLTTRADSLAAEATEQRQLAQRLQSDLRRRETQIQTLEKELERLKAIDLRLSQPRKGQRTND